MAIRKSVTNLTQDEKKHFVDGVKALKGLPAPSPPLVSGSTATNLYDSFVEVHARSMATLTPPGNTSNRNAAHRGPAFLPWHREFCLRFEQALQSAIGDTNFGLPYWDWAADSALADPTDPLQAVVWRNDFLGGQNVSESAHPFRPAEWTIFPSGTLVREFGAHALGPSLPTQADVNASLSVSTYDSSPWDHTSSPSFRNHFEGWSPPNGLHNRVHLWVGGSMLPGTSPNDPVFFLHHCNCDRIWALWQICHPTVPYAPASGGPTGHNLTDRMFPWTSSSDRQISDLLDINALGYSYEDFHRRFVTLQRTAGDRFVSTQTIEISPNCDIRNDNTTTIFLPAEATGAIRARFENVEAGAAAGDVNVIVTLTDEITVSS